MGRPSYKKLWTEAQNKLLKQQEKTSRLAKCQKAVRKFGETIYSRVLRNESYEVEEFEMVALGEYVLQHCRRYPGEDNVGGGLENIMINGNPIRVKGK